MSDAIKKYKWHKLKTLAGKKIILSPDSIDMADILNKRIELSKLEQ